jgi:hypothetical protein
MALISCPERTRRISDQALSCPGCGYPLRQERTSSDVQGRTLADVLVGHRWEARSETLGSGLPGTSLDATFQSAGGFEGRLKTPPGDILARAQQVNGRWHVVGSLLFLNYSYVMGGIPSPTEVAIEIT